MQAFLSIEFSLEIELSYLILTFDYSYTFSSIIFLFTNTII